ncbi:MAG: PaaI family thioesterase [Betaproteobacteria bacterium]|nr:PaaI family thioesterase [Betaproteobacteria bacterium]NBY08399.1 PaaI family thioesterase [Betaproteobacteria bacterium]
MNQTTQELTTRIQQSFDRQGLLKHWGAKLMSVREGEVVIALPYSEKITQQQGGFHGGAMGAIADVAAGYAGLSVAPEGMEVTTVEYKINFLAAFESGQLQAKGEVVKRGKRLIITKANVTHIAEDGKVSDCALLQQTLIPVAKTYE